MVRSTTATDGMARYLERNDLAVDPTDLSREDAIENAAERAYYRACLSDSTYHGVNHGAKVNAVSSIVKRWDVFDVDDFREVDEAADQLIADRRAGGR